jgi:hypothetical protein
MSRPGRRAAAVVLATVAFIVPATAHAAAPQIAAYEFHNGTNGFDIGLVNATTGATVLVPAAVNTTADEYHPALSPDGRFLVFTRTTLFPQPDGDIVPPQERVLLMLDRETGAVRQPFSDHQAGGTGATVLPGQTPTNPVLAYGRRVFDSESNNQLALLAGPLVSGSSPLSFDQITELGVPKRFLGNAQAPMAGTFVDVPHAAALHRAVKLFQALAVVRVNEGNGSVVEARTLLFDQTLQNGQVSNFVTATLTDNTPLHATPRMPDNHVALDTTTASGTDISTIQFPGDSAPGPAPAPINTSGPERMPAWSADGTQLGFVRTTDTTSATPKRKVLLFDQTPGVQAIVNPAVSIGNEAPTPQLRAFQATWGGLSLAQPSSFDSVLVSCGVVCGQGIVGPTGSGISLRPKIQAGTRVGILIARRVGTRRLFGHAVPKIRKVGRVPLGVARGKRPSFRWNAKVNGKRLRAGTYLLTFRSLNAKGRILSTSGSLQFKLSRAGRISKVRRLGR